MPKRRLEGKMNFHWEDLTYEDALNDYEKVYSEWFDFCRIHLDFYDLILKKKRDIEDLAYLSLHPDLALKICN